jgi:uncharacterized protein
MPYYITDNADGCSGWATVKDDGEVLGCHDTKQEAIGQALAVAQSEGSTFEGERYKKDKKKRRDLPDAYRPATADDVPEGRACGNCMFFDESDVAPDGRAMCTRWDEYVEGGFYCDAWQEMDAERVAPDAVKVGDYVSWGSSGGTARGRITRIVRSGTLSVPDTDFTLNADDENPAALIRVYRPDGDGWSPSGPLVGHRFRTLTKIDPLPEPSDEDRAVDLKVPQVIRNAAKQGLEFHREGKSGSGLVPRTVREASAMAAGNITEDKVIRANAWAARHKVDLQKTGARPGQDGYPTAGAVAHLLWGIPTGAGYDAATSWFARKAEQIKDDRSIGMDVTPVKARSASSGMEFRSTTVELRAEGDGNTFVGYAAMFNSPSQPLPFTERIAPGAFDKTLRNRKRDVRLYVNHNSDLVLASKRSGTLMLSEDGRGLRVEAQLPATTYANDLRALMQTGVVDRMSFGFTVPRGGDRWSDDGRERELREIVLHEVSVVTGFPAYEQTQASVRSLTTFAERVGMDLDEINEVLDALADNEQVDPAKAARLIDALHAATPAPEPDPSPVLIGLQKKRLELLSKKP